MAIDKEAIKEHIRGILVALGDDPNREGLKETPDRVAKMYEEVFEGMNYSNHEIAQMFSKTFEDDLSVKDHKDMVIVKDIDIFIHGRTRLARAIQTPAPAQTGRLPRRQDPRRL